MDSSINSDMGSSDSGGAQEICASLDSLSVNGTPPAVGDKVEFKTEGTVTRVEGGNAYIEPETVNGSPVMGDSGGPGDSEPDESSLRQNAQNVDRQQYADGGIASNDASSPDNRGGTMQPFVRSKMKKSIRNLHYNPYGSGPEDVNLHGG